MQHDDPPYSLPADDLPPDDGAFFGDPPPGDAEAGPPMFDVDAPAFDHGDFEQQDTEPLRGMPAFDLPQPQAQPGRRPGSRQPGQQPAPAAAVATPPADTTTERALLSCCMIDSNCATMALQHVRAEDFHDPRHQSIFESVARLAALNRQTDAVSLLSDLEHHENLARVGTAYLLELTSLIGSTLAVEHYAKRIAKLAMVRRLLGVTHQVMAAGYKSGVDPDDFVLLVESEMGAALRDTVKEGAAPIAEVVHDVWASILRARERGGEIMGIQTGYRDIDQLLHGFHATDLMILAARPAMGKTAFALNLALEVARRPRRDPVEGSTQHGVMIFSMEMGRDQLVQRLMSSRSDVNMGDIRTGRITNEDEVRLMETAQELSELRIFIDDATPLSVLDVRARALRVRMSGPLDLVVIDYLQLMKGTGGAKQSREQEISEISRGLKGLAKELHCTVLALSQLNRSVEHRTDKRPMMSDLRESGAIEQDADIISFIYRDHVYNKDAPETDAELIIAKHRAGETGKINLHFDGKRVRFLSRTDINDNYAGMG